MSRLAARVEISKLARILGVERSQIQFLEGVAAQEIRSLRQAVSDALFGIEPRLFRGLAKLVRWLPARLAAWLAEHRFGALVTAHAANQMSARRVTHLTRSMSTDFLVDVCLCLDPRRARDLFRQQPLERIIEVALEAVRRKEFMAIGGYVDVLSDEMVAALEAAVEDDEALLRVAFFVESTNRLDHLVRLMPRDRVRRAILLALDDSRDLMAEVASLIVHVGYSLKKDLGELAAEQDDAVFERLVRFTEEQELWDELVPVIAMLTEPVQRRIMNLAIFKQEPAFLESALRITDAHDLWSTTLPFIRLMEDGMRTLLAAVAAQQPRASMERAANAALIGEHWDALLDVVGRMPAAKQRELAEIVERYGDVDADLARRVRLQAEGYGLRDAFAGLTSESRSGASSASACS